MTDTQHLPFRFLAIPPEIRNQIYAEILTATYLAQQPSLLNLPPQLRISTRLAILRVSKVVHREAEKIFYEKGNFLIKIPFDGFRFDGFPFVHGTTQPLTNFLQNIHLDAFTDSSFHRNHLLHPTVACIEVFSGTSIPRSTFVLDVRLGCVNLFIFKFMDDASLTDALSKLTGFKTVAVSMEPMFPSEADWRLSHLICKLDEDLSVTLGPREEEKFDGARKYGLKYHPQKPASGKEAAST